MNVLLIRSASVAQCRRQIERQLASDPGSRIDLLLQPAVREQFDNGLPIGRVHEYRGDRFRLRSLLPLLPAIRRARYDLLLIPDNGIRGLSYRPLARFALLSGAREVRFVALDGTSWRWDLRAALAELGPALALVGLRLFAVARIAATVLRALWVRGRGRGICLVARCAESNFSTRVRVTQLAPQLEALGIPARPFYPATAAEWQAELARCRGPHGDRRYQRLLWGKHLKSRLAALVEGARSGAIYFENEALSIHAVPPLIELLARWLVRRVIYETDDAYFHDRRYRYWLGRLYAGADLVVVSGPHLARFARRHSRRVATVPMGIELTAAPRRLSSPRLVVGWCGGSSSLPGLQALQPALRAFLAAHPRAELEVAAGADPGDLLDLPYRFVPLIDGRETEPLARWDIGLVPTEDTPFNHGRCVYKLLQYLACGVCPLSSTVGDNLGFFGPHELLRAAPGEWYERLCELAADAGLRARLVAAGQAVLVREFDQRRLGPRLARVVAGVA